MARCTGPRSWRCGSRPPDRQRAAIDKHIAVIADKQARIAKRLADIDDDDVVAPLMAELQTLSARKKAAEVEHDDLLRRIADHDAETARVASLATWCQTVAVNLDTLSYDEKRLALTALGVNVRLYRQGATKADGTPYPRWEMTMRPAVAAEQVVCCSTRSALHNTPLVTLRWTDRDAIEPVAMAAD